MPAYVSLALLPQLLLKNKSHYPVIDMYQGLWAGFQESGCISASEFKKSFNLSQRISVTGLSPKNSHDEVLISSASEYALIWN